MVLEGRERVNKERWWWERGGRGSIRRGGARGEGEGQ